MRPSLTIPIDPLSGYERLSQDCRKSLFRSLAGDPADNRADFIAKYGRRVPGTCEWIKTNEMYLRWLSIPSQLLWLSGSAGKGKSMLAIYLTQELELLAKDSETVASIFFFCTSSQKRDTAPAIMRGLIFQLIQKRPGLIDYLLPKFEIQRHSLFDDTAFEALWVIFEQMIRDPSLKKIYFVLDGLDECVPESLEILLDKLKYGFEAGSMGSLQMIAISRAYPDTVSYPTRFRSFFESSLIGLP